MHHHIQNPNQHLAHLKLPHKYITSPHIHELDFLKSAESLIKIHIVKRKIYTFY